MFKRDKVRYAVVGLGWISQDAMLPAFAHARDNSELVALVSGDPDKLRTLGRKYRVDKLYRYEQYDEMLHSGEVDAVYIALPNSMHADYAVRAAQAGVHVLCEKPMAVDEQQCGEMIRAALASHVKLMVAYRLHFEEANLAAIDLVQSGELGPVRLFESVFGLDVKPGDIRLQQHLGGGVLYDLGVYCINAARYLFRAEPYEVVAWAANDGEPRFAEVDEMITCLLRFPGQRLATFACTFGAEAGSSFKIAGPRGYLRVEPAFSHVGDLEHFLTVDGRTRHRKFKSRDQFAPQLLYFSQCVLEDRQPEPGGSEGLADVRIIRALLQSIALGKPVALSETPVELRPGMHQEIERPEPAKPGLVKAESPHKAK